MATYVDPIVRYPRDRIKPAARQHGEHWCHLVADTTEELHALADRIGLKRGWFQDGGTVFAHYDLTPFMRDRAVKLGAVELDHHGFADWLVARYEQLRAERQAAKAEAAS